MTREGRDKSSGGDKHALKRTGTKSYRDQSIGRGGGGGGGGGLGGGGGGEAVFHSISLPVITNRFWRVAKTRSWVLPFCNPISDVINSESIAKVLNTSQANIFVLIIWKQRSNIAVPLGAQYRSTSLHKY